MYHKTPDLGSLSKFKLNAYKEKNIFRSTSVWHPYCSSNFKPGLTLKLGTEKYIRFLQK